MKALRPGEKSHLLRFSAGLFLIYLVFMNPSPDTSSALPHIHLAVSIVDHRSIALTDYAGIDVAKYKGRFLSGFPPGLAVLSAAAYQIFRPAFPREADERTIFWLNALSVVLISISLTVLTTAAYFAMIRSFPVKLEMSVWVLMLVALGTPSFSYSGSFYKKGIVGLVFFLAVFLIWPREEERVGHYGSNEGLSSSRLFSAGLIAGFCVMMDYAMAVFVPFLPVYLWRKRVPMQRIGWFLGGCAIMAAFLLWYHQAAFGHPLRTSYSYRYPATVALQFIGLSPSLMWKRLFGLHCGLFIYAPILFLAVFGWWIFVRDRVFREEMIWLVAGPVVAYFLFYSSWRQGYWCGGEALVVRNMVPVFPLALLPLAAGCESAPRPLLHAIGGLSLIFAYLGAQSFFLSFDYFPLVTSLKNAVASLGSGELFSRFLPRLAGVDTPLSIPGGKFSPLVSDPQRLLRLMSAQLVFSIAQFTLVLGIWRVFMRASLRALASQK